ncbi:Na/Pi-cotransporter II-like protein [Thauera propionica]|jgi:phosphate:Na+ symporter|uniref:Na/Pi-cotransporter II-like protein n=1 Tax=Thauera propionica TaxID=2019431 RepID=A0A235F1S0_9RHOO|nr:Na/Pi-cotransporter II-like protein [Thauera propionica]
MHMMTEGLKLAAGRALEGLLERGTATAPRGLAAGMTITALVQSSTAVTVASIGFVNTGLLSLKNALWVIFGSNVGTTMNAWLVAALGFGFRIDAFALPFVGIGAVLMLAGRTLRARALGQALAGFGVLFLGIDVLKDSFSGVGSMIDLQDFITPGVAGWLILIGIGTVLTVLMQASGAVIAIVITAAQGGLLTVEAACAMVIGTNIGTTSTAILSAMGATSNARRLAAAHVLFNFVTGAMALLMLPLLITLLGVLREWFEQPATPAVMIAMFHTAFNLLGVLLMVPIAPLMLRTLAGHFRTREEEVARPHYLDTNSLAIPDLAIHALRMELARTQGFAVAALAAANRLPPDEASVEHETSALQALAPAIGNYARQLSAASLPPALVETLAHCLRTLQYQETTAMLMREAVALAGNLARTATRDFSAEIETFRQSVAHLAEAADPERPDFSPGAVSVRLEEAEAQYQKLKEALLLGGAHARLDIHTMQDWLRLASLERRATEQVAKGARMLAALEEGTSAAEVARNDEAERTGNDPIEAADANAG